MLWHIQQLRLYNFMVVLKTIADKSDVFVCVCLQLHDTLKKKEKAFKALQERNVHLRQLADRAKHLASVLEVRDGFVCTRSKIINSKYF